MINPELKILRRTNRMSAESSPIRPPIGQPAKVVSIGSNSISTNDDDQQSSRTFLIFNAMPSWLASFLLNISLILVLALFAITTEEKNTISLVSGETESASLDDVSINLEDLELENADPL